MGMALAVRLLLTAIGETPIISTAFPEHPENMPQVGPNDARCQRSNHVGSGRIGLPCLFRINPEEHRGIVAAALCHDMDRHSLVQKDRFVTCPQIVETEVQPKR